MTPLTSELEISKTSFDLYSEKQTILGQFTVPVTLDLILNCRLSPCKFSMADLKNPQNRDSSRVCPGRAKEARNLEGFWEHLQQRRLCSFFFFAHIF